jgi:hypothetical protein
MTKETATFSEASQVSYIPHFCAHCRKLGISPLDHREICAELVYRLPYLVSEARAAAKDGCSLYRTFIGLIIRLSKHFETVSSIANHTNSDTEKDYGQRLYGTNLVLQLADRLTKYLFHISVHSERWNGPREAVLAVYESRDGTIRLEANACAGTEFAYNHKQ